MDNTEATKVTDNPVLQDVADIALSRPDFTPEQWELVEKAAPYYKALLKPEVRQALELEYAAKYDQFVDTARQETQVAVNAKFEEWKKASQPIATDDLKKLISQEYEEISVPIKLEAGGIKHCVIRELPKAVEKRFINVLKKALVPLLEEKALANFKWDLSDSMASKINTIIDMIPNGLDVMAEICAVCLDPFEKDKDINGAWVSSNMSTARIQAVVLLQFEANKYRDFFLSGFRLFQNLSNRSTI